MSGLEVHGAPGKSAVLPVAPEGIEWTACSLSVVDAEMSYERVEEIIWRVRGARDATAWWLGDLLRFAESRWGEKYAQAMDATGLSYGRLANIVSTCERVSDARRREDLSFAHHEAVASLEPAEQIEWLEAAAKSSWTEAQLREALREAAVLTRSPARQTRASAAGDGPSASETVDAARNLSVLRETLDLVGVALEGGEGAGDVVDKLAEKLPDALRALEEASAPIRNASSGGPFLEQARAVVKEATTSNGFYMIPVVVFESFKVAVESQT